MALIAMCAYCTETNGRLEYAKKCLDSIVKTVDLNKHRLFLIDNGSCQEAMEFLIDFISKNPATLMGNTENLGTARGINRALKLREKEEYCVKIDEDVVINHDNWLEEMEAAFERDPRLGILGLKRKDVEWDGRYIPLPHKMGETWITVETGKFIMGTCTMFNWRLLDKIGGLKQASVYGNDDTLYSLRSYLAGFQNAYFPHINIDHIDRGDNPYIQEKHQKAAEGWTQYQQWYKEYEDGTRPLWEYFE